MLIVNSYEVSVKDPSFIERVLSQKKHNFVRSNVFRLNNSIRNAISEILSVGILTRYIISRRCWPTVTQLSTDKAVVACIFNLTKG